MTDTSFRNNVLILSTLANNITQTVTELQDLLNDADDHDGQCGPGADHDAALARLNAIGRAASLQASADSLALLAKSVRNQLKGRPMMG